MVRRRQPWAAAVLLLSWTTRASATVTVKLRPKEPRCLWNEMTDGEKGNVEVFVESGGKLTARLEIVGPFALDEEGTPSLNDDRAVTIHDAVFSSAETSTESFASPTYVAFTATTAGAYRVCVDNAGARFENKVVSIDFRTSGATDDDDLPVALKHDPQASEGVAQLTKRLAAVRTELAVLKEKQARERRRLAHHRALNEASHVAVVEGSLLETVVYIIASCFQIVFVRKWFEGKGVTTIFGSDHV